MLTEAFYASCLLHSGQFSINQEGEILNSPPPLLEEDFQHGHIQALARSALIATGPWAKKGKELPVRADL